MTDFIFRKTYQLDEIYSVEISSSIIGFEALWSPDLPSAEKRESLWPVYQKALNAFFDALNPGHTHLLIPILDPNPAQ